MTKRWLWPQVIHTAELLAEVLDYLTTKCGFGIFEDSEYHWQDANDTCGDDEWYHVRYYLCPKAPKDNEAAKTDYMVDAGDLIYAEYYVHDPDVVSRMRPGKKFIDYTEMVCGGCTQDEFRDMLEEITARKDVSSVLPKKIKDKLANLFDD